MVKLSVLLTVHDREDSVLLAVLRQLTRGPASEMQVVVVNDMSERFKYEWLQPFLAVAFKEHKIIEMEPYERFNLEGKYGNPAKAFNAGLAACESDRVLIMSSDTLIPPDTIRKSFMWNLKDGPWTPRVMDIETQGEYCGQSRLFPMPWALFVDREAAVTCGGWDEAYLGGLCYEDNDFVGRLVVMQGQFCTDWTANAYHISHDQPAYDVDKENVKAANDRNRQITKEKWGGIPFDREFTPFDTIRSPHPSGLGVQKVTCSKKTKDMLGLPVDYGVKN